MSNASNSAKSRWNASHYTQVKIAVSPDVADAFKAACAAAGVSMASVLSQFMAEYGAVPITKKPSTKTAPMSSTKRRRNTVRAVIPQLEQVRDAQEKAIDNTPDNLRSSDNFAVSEERLSSLEQAIEILDGIY